MLIFSVIAMCSHLYSVYLVSRVLKNTYFKEHLLVIASKYTKCGMKTILGNLNCVQCLNKVLMEKAWFMVPKEYNPKGKELCSQRNIPSWFIAPMERYGFMKIIFRSGNRQCKRDHSFSTYSKFSEKLTFLTP